MKPTKEQIATAYHEAGHAVAALTLGAEFSWVEIDLATNAGLLRRDAYHPGAVLSGRWIGADAEIMLTMAGPMAEGEHVCGFAFDGFEYESAEDDMVQLRGTFALAGYDVDARQPWERLADSTYSLLAAHWPAVERVAAALLERQTLTGAEVRKVIYTLG